MSSVLCLQILMWIPIRIEDDHCISRLEIQSKTTSARAEKKDEEFRSWVIESTKELASLLRFGRPVQSQVQKSSVVEVILQRKTLSSYHFAHKGLGSPP